MDLGPARWPAGAQSSGMPQRETALAQSPSPAPARGAGLLKDDVSASSRGYCRLVHNDSWEPHKLTLLAMGTPSQRTPTDLHHITLKLDYKTDSLYAQTMFLVKTFRQGQSPPGMTSSHSQGSSASAAALMRAFVCYSCYFEEALPADLGSHEPNQEWQARVQNCILETDNTTTPQEVGCIHLHKLERTPAGPSICKLTSTTRQHMHQTQALEDRLRLALFGKSGVLNSTRIYACCL